MAASNTNECFREVVGLRVKGVLFNALPIGRRDLSGGNKTLIFEDGRGLTISTNGSFWIESAEEVARAISIAKDKLKASQRDLKDVLDLAGEPL
jgi:hypothetical protein